MATSGTTSFNLDIDDIIQEAYERCGMRTNSGYELKSARRSLNILFEEWENRGIHLWKVELKEQLLKWAEEQKEKKVEAKKAPAQEKEETE